MRAAAGMLLRCPIATPCSIEKRSCHLRNSGCAGAHARGAQAARRRILFDAERVRRPARVNSPPSFKSTAKKRRRWQTTPQEPYAPIAPVTHCARPRGRTLSRFISRANGLSKGLTPTQQSSTAPVAGEKERAFSARRLCQAGTGSAYGRVRPSSRHLGLGRCARSS